ncbi:MAG: hypothetical protein R3319_02455 [Candidatus Bathyarchaeia archaeon]|nr:hypothetical protein [Candidatus Bathyarchaeia archaeon]
MESFYGFIRRLIGGFTDSGLDYAFTGALATSFYGVPRTTTDIDVIVAISDAGDVTGKVAGALRQAGLEVDLRSIDMALESGYRIASFRDKSSPYTLDVIFVEALKKNAGIAAGLNTFFQAPDDLVLAKLRMIKATKPRSRAVKDEEDVKAILEFTEVDLEAVKARAKHDATLAILEGLLG